MKGDTWLQGYWLKWSYFYQLEDAAAESTISTHLHGMHPAFLMQSVWLQRTPPNGGQLPASHKDTPSCRRGSLKHHAKDLEFLLFYDIFQESILLVRGGFFIVGSTFGAKWCSTLTLEDSGSLKYHWALYTIKNRTAMPKVKITFGEARICSYLLWWLDFKVGCGGSLEQKGHLIKMFSLIPFGTAWRGNQIVCRIFLLCFFNKTKIM